MSQWGLADLERRLANLLRVGVIEELDDANALVTVRAGDTLTGWLPWMTHRAGADRTWWAPEPGEQVLLLAPSGELSQAMVLPAIYQTAYPAPGNVRTLHRTEYADGAVIEYDRAAHQLLADIGDGAGGATSSINMDRTRILLSSNGSTLEMDAAGIRLNGTRIDLN